MTTTMQDINAALNPEGEVVAELADGWTLVSGATDYVSGEYVTLRRPDGTVYAHWDSVEWQEDPVLVMGAIINAAAGFRPIEDPRVG